MTKLTRWIVSGCCALQLICFGLFSNSRAEDGAEIRVPADSKFVLQFDLQSLRKSKIGGVLFEAAQKAALEEMGKNEATDGLTPAKINEILGFDPFEEIRGIVIAASDYSSPEESLVAMVRLKKTTGNIEGLLLGVPGYEKTTHGKYELHSASPDEGKKVFGVIHEDKSSNKTIIIGAKKDSVTQMLASLDGELSDNKSYKAVALDNTQKELLNIQLTGLPTDKLGDGPQSKIASLITSVSFSIAENDDELDINANLKTTTAKQAEQIRQSIQGLYAMMELARSMETDDDDLQQFVGLLQGIKVTTSDDTVKVRMQLPSKAIVKMINDELASN